MNYNNKLEANRQGHIVVKINNIEHAMAPFSIEKHLDSMSGEMDDCLDDTTNTIGLMFEIVTKAFPTIPAATLEALEYEQLEALYKFIEERQEDRKAQQDGTVKFDGKQYILGVVLESATKPGGFREGMKGALG
ncbi:MAG: hypothetical protein HQL72_14030 [Magnetococcales bacterium]|nr:hypothetical protein [Magnetococcales bacterium]